MIFLEYVGSRACLSANKKCKSSICEVYTFFMFKTKIFIYFYRGNVKTGQCNNSRDSSTKT